MSTTITAAVLDSALADISDVPTVEVNDDGNPTITFSGNYENPINDLVEFLSRLQRTDEEVASAAREGLEWSEGHYGGYATAIFNGLVLDGVSIYAEADDEDEDS